MRRPARTRSFRPPKAERQAGSRRDRLAVLLGLVTLFCLGAAFILSQDTEFLMPGPLASSHGAIENCSACHTKSGRGKLSWIHGLIAGDPLADSKACLTCHKMPDTAFNAHGASAAALKQSTERLTKIAAATPAPQWARTQSIAFPTHDVVAGGLSCATCHQEHKGVNFNLNKIANEECHSCHVVKFDSFDGHHPKFENYPFKRRTRIIYDHAGHFDKHFPEVAQKKGLARRIPTTCSTCHDSRKDKKVMAVAPFEQTCTACHLDQITGKERVSGPKGIAFLTLPGLDLQTLKERKASIGEWPDASEAELTPFMKMMISRNERGRALIRIVTGLNLQDLIGALRGNGAHHLIDTFEPFRAFLRLEGLEVTGDRRNGVGSGACADQCHAGEENFVSSHKRIFGLKGHFKSSKLMTMTIGQVAKASGLSASAIRFYEKEGLLPQPVRSSGQRRYDRKVLERLALLEFAKECGFALSEARTLLNAFADDAPLSERLRGVAQRKIAELDAKAQRIARSKERIERAVQCRCGDLGECGRRILAIRTRFQA
jgi:DNA-binding transcriptional MerR regulator